MRTMRSFMVQYGPFSGEFYWPIRRRQFAWINQAVFEDLTHVWRLVFCRNDSGERWRSCCKAWRCRRWTIGSRTSFGLSRDGVQRNVLVMGPVSLGENSIEIQNLSVVHAIQATGPTDDILQRHPGKTSSPLASAVPLALQLHHCSIGFPDAWRTTYAIQRTPSRLVTTPLSLL